MIHCFTVCGQFMVMDVESGAVHRVDGTAYRVLQWMQSQWENDPAFQPADTVAGSNAAGVIAEMLGDVPASEVEEILTEIVSLVQDGQLFAPDNAERAMSHMREREPVVKALCLHMAHECNLRCAYCFAGQGAYGGERGLMSLETGRKAIDFLLSRSGRRRHLEVDFFGGEPMLNFDTVKEIVSYGRAREAETGKKFRFTLTTNGTRLDEDSIRYINLHMDNVVLSIDGRPAVHDRMRKRPDGVGGYADILHKLLQMAESRAHERYYVRGTYTRFNPDFSEDVLHLAEAGFRQISVEPVVTAPSEPYAIRPEDVPGLCAEYEKLAAALLLRRREGRPVNFFHFNIDLDGGPCIAKRITGCGAGTEYLAVTPGGALYPCHQFVGEEAFCLGSLDTGIEKPDIGQRFARCHVWAKPECARCWAKYYCGGGCAANAYHASGNGSGDILHPDETGCALQRKRIECALFLYAENAT